MLRRCFVCVLFVCVVCVFAGRADAFTGQTDEVGSVKIEIGEIEPVRKLDAEVPFGVTITNGGATDVACSVSVRSIDTIRVTDGAAGSIVVPAGKSVEYTGALVATGGTFSALYPLHVLVDTKIDERPQRLHAVQVFETDLASTSAAPGEVPQGEPAELAVLDVAPDSELPLTQMPRWRVGWRYYEGEASYPPLRWRGPEPTSRALFLPETMEREGADGKPVSRSVLHMHPPYRPTGGSIWVEYRLKLPADEPIRLSFFGAMRDMTEYEPPSDGVAYRVRVNGELVFERVINGATWQPVEVDLIRFAGQEVTLALESHPGPKRNTVCDSCYWGDPVLRCGAPRTLDAAARKQLTDRALAAVRSGEVGANENDIVLLPLDDGFRAAVALGPTGLLDGVIALGDNERQVAYDGLQVEVDRMTLHGGSVLMAVRETSRDVADGTIKLLYAINPASADPLTLSLSVETEKRGLRIFVDSDQPNRLTDITFGPTDRHAPRVYYGHGYCIAEPEAFRAHGGGHTLSTSHVGFDFDGGLSLVMAATSVPEWLEVDPARRLYRLRTHPSTTLTLVPGRDGALEAARAYRPLSHLKPGPGVPNKAGRLVLDIWGGTFTDQLEKTRQLVDYGVTDAIFINHVWQRWGYDNRLPDIFPPNPQAGTLDELRELAQFCRDNNIRFGLHDNYIDFYPDADDYSYDHITFGENGQPRKAWINYHYDAQSYQFRPDAVQRFLDRNLKLLHDADLPLTTAFVDVFASLSPFDYFDRDGNFHSARQTRECWAEAFDTIRESLGGEAPTISEAGADFLAGHLDGSDCQIFRLVRVGQEHTFRLPCEDWEIVPWFDVVSHTAMSLHGVGYSGRYQGGRSRETHGIESDDYLSAEILTGHAPMIDRGAMVRGGVRKAWLVGDVLRAVGLDEIERVEAVDGDIHRQIVHWRSGATFHVNRGQADWTVGGRALPPFGFFAKVDDSHWASVERIGSRVVEQSRSGDRYYVGARAGRPDPTLLEICPRLEKLEDLGEGQFKVTVRWQADRPAPKDLSIFHHFHQPSLTRHRKTEGFVSGGGWPSTPTSQWQGDMIFGSEWTSRVPDDLPAGRYQILVGLYDAAGNGQRYGLLGEDAGGRRYCIGEIVVERPRRPGSDEVEAARVTLGECTVDPLIGELSRRLLPPNGPIEFGAVKTDGDIRVEVDRPGGSIRVTPLPESRPASVEVDLAKLFGAAASDSVRVVAVDPKGTVVREVPSKQSDGRVQFQTASGEFAYRLAVGKKPTD